MFVDVECAMTNHLLLIQIPHQNALKKDPVN